MSVPLIKKILNSIKYLTEKTKDSGWIKATLTDDFKNYDDNEANSLKYRKIGKQVEIRGALSPVKADNVLNSGTWTNACTLPADYKPSFNVGKLSNSSTTNVFLAEVNTSGILRVGRYRSGSSYASTPPETSTWLPIHITYLVD